MLKRTRSKVVRVDLDLLLSFKDQFTKKSEQKLLEMSPRLIKPGKMDERRKDHPSRAEPEVMLRIDGSAVKNYVPKARVKPAQV